MTGSHEVVGSIPISSTTRRIKGGAEISTPFSFPTEVWDTIYSKSPATYSVASAGGLRS